MNLLERVRNVLGLAPSQSTARYWPVGVAALLLPLGLWCLSLAFSPAAQADDDDAAKATANRIDEIVAKKLAEVDLPKEKDARGALLKRWSLDIVGRLPTAEEVAKFEAADPEESQLILKGLLAQREDDKPRPDRERPDGNRPRPDRERPDRERPEGDRPRPDRERPEGDRPRPERERPDADRPRPEGGRERPMPPRGREGGPDRFGPREGGPDNPILPLMQQQRDMMRVIAELREEVMRLRHEVNELREGRGGPDRPGADRPMPRREGEVRDRPRPDGPPRDGDRPRPDGPRGDRPRPDGERRPEGDRPRPDGPRRETAETDRAVEIEIELKRD